MFIGLASLKKIKINEWDEKNYFKDINDIFEPSKILCIKTSCNTNYEVLSLFTNLRSLVIITAPRIKLVEYIFTNCKNLNSLKIKPILQNSLITFVKELIVLIQ